MHKIELNKPITPWILDPQIFKVQHKNTCPDTRSLKLVRHTI